MIAALYVDARGVYADLPGVDAWPITRDARLYAGPHPVVAHPPCARFCLLAKLVESQGGRPAGRDDGEFAAALSAVRRWGGVLEHPAWSMAWAAHNLAPPPHGGWQRTICGGWTTQVDQGRYGHRARKRTWLYVVGDYLPHLDWRPAQSERSWSGPRMGRPELTKRERSYTPPAFRDLLIAIADGAGPR